MQSDGEIMKTTNQKNMVNAAKRVKDICSQAEDYRKSYGILCHKFPVMVLTCGLCQAVAFSLSKKGSVNAREKAHARLLEDLEALLGTKPEQIAECDAVTYMLYTRQTLAAWVYYKRFAESILGVKSGQEDQNGS
jgi:CRISPR-associated protein Cmr5